LQSLSGIQYLRDQQGLQNTNVARKGNDTPLALALYEKSEHAQNIRKVEKEEDTGMT
jgi:hypothetical protein